MGKTKWMVAVLVELMRRYNFAADFWYTDGTQADLMTEFVAYCSGQDTAALQNPKKYVKMMTKGRAETFHAAVARAQGEIAGFDLDFYAQGAPRAVDIRLQSHSRAARLKKPYAVVVDYVQNCTAGFEGRDADRLNATAVTKMLAALRTDLGCAVFGLAQFNRKATEGRAFDLPQPHHLAASSQMERDVNHMLIFHRPAEMKQDATRDEKKAAVLWQALSKHNATDRRFVTAELGTLRFTAADSASHAYLQGGGA